MSSKTWTSAGISIATSIVAQGYAKSDMSRALVNGAVERSFKKQKTAASGRVKKI